MKSQLRYESKQMSTTHRPPQSSKWSINIAEIVGRTKDSVE